MNTPLVSIITPAYNCSAKLTETVQSVKAQTYKNWELLIIDDCSKDDTLSIALHLAKDEPRIRVFKQDYNGGASLARNRGINEARGKYIAFLDGDDMWLPYKLEYQIRFMEVHNCKFCYSPYYVLEDGANMENMPIRNCPKTIEYKQLLKWNRIGCLTVVINIDCLGKINIPKLDKRNDYALWLMYLRSGTVACSFDEPLAVYRSHQGISKGNKMNFIKYHYQMYKKVLQYGSFISFLMTVRNVVCYFLYKQIDIESK